MRSPLETNQAFILGSNAPRRGTESRNVRGSLQVSLKTHTPVALRERFWFYDDLKSREQNRTAPTTQNVMFHAAR
jgi:hypothetical protein